MKEFKRSALRVFFCIEILVFVGIYFFGVHGIQALMRLQEENVCLEREIVALKAGVAELESDIHVWNSQPFYKEKIAREQLQMARSGDTVYYVA